MNYTTLKILIKLSDKESVQAYTHGNKYTDTPYRILTENDAREEVYSAYRNDTYMLGCFNPEFVNQYILLDYDDIKTLQDGGSFDIIGKLVMNSGEFETMMDDYISVDGYGHALSSYDGDHKEVTLEGEDYIVYRQN